ncbi:MAG: GMC family oxidoreductase [Spongiibacteraceae bacterium]
MVVDGNFVAANSHFRGQICIVGGGVAGIVLANELQDAYEDIIIVESGDEHYVPEAQELYQAEKYPDQLPDPMYSRMRFLGGSSNHWQNNTSPLSPSDFEKRDWVPNSGWPISFSDINPYYKKAQYYCGVGEDGYNTKQWSSVLNKKDEVEESALLITAIAKASSPPVRFYQAYGERLKSASNITILTNSNMVDIVYDSSDKRVRQIDIVSNRGGNITVSADKFVFAMGGIENARMLLVFNQKYSDQLGNQGGNVGCYFMEHPTPRAAQLFADDVERLEFYKSVQFKDRTVVGFLSLSEQVLHDHQTTNLRMPLIPKDEYTLSDGISSSHILAESFARHSLPDNFSDHLYNIVGDMDMVIEAVARKTFGIKLFEHANKITGFQIPMMMEQTPDKNNRIYLGRAKDRLGIPKVSIDYFVSGFDKACVWRSLMVVAQEVGALSLGRLKVLEERAERLWSNQLGFSDHHMGTTRMSSTPEYGVVDENLKVFGVKNLYIAGSSVFSTGGHVPPTLTIAAMSIRLAEYLKNV